jgi:hypothetical protein
MLKWLALSSALMGCGSVSNGGNNNPDGGSPPGDTGMPMACVQTACAADKLTVCLAGVIDHTESCALGCFTDATRCNGVAPSNGLAAVLDQAAQQPATTLPGGSTIDSDSGIVMAAGTPVVVTNTTVTQPGGPTVRVLIARSWTLNGVRIRGSLPVAFVSTEEIKIQGVIDASADAEAGGAGAVACGATGGGGSAQGFFERPRVGTTPGLPAFLWASNGFGGGGFGAAGGAGGTRNAGLLVGTPGVVNGNDELVPLRGGCEGGGQDAAHRGGGGGAVQFVSGQSVHVTANGAIVGVVHVGGGRGVAGALGRTSTDDTTPVWGPAGGGSGGGILIEAPSVTFDENVALLAGGGGGGGYGLCNPMPDGADAAPTTAGAPGGTCPVGTSPLATGGDGATTGGGAAGQDNTFNGAAAGGGGGVGRIRINTADGQYAAKATTVLRGAATTGLVGRR